MKPSSNVLRKKLATKRNAVNRKKQVSSQHFVDPFNFDVPREKQEKADRLHEDLRTLRLAEQQIKSQYLEAKTRERIEAEERAESMTRTSIKNRTNSKTSSKRNKDPTVRVRNPPIQSQSFTTTLILNQPGAFPKGSFSLLPYTVPHLDEVVSSDTLHQLETIITTDKTVCQGIDNSYVVGALRHCAFCLYVHSGTGTTVYGTLIATINPSNSSQLFIDVLCGSPMYSGVGSLLMRIVTRIAKHLGLNVIRLDSLVDAKEFYTKIGFTNTKKHYMTNAERNRARGLHPMSRRLLTRKQMKRRLSRKLTRKSTKPKSRTSSLSSILSVPSSPSSPSSSSSHSSHSSSSSKS